MTPSSQWVKGVLASADKIETLKIKLSILYISDPPRYITYWMGVFSMWVMWGGMVEIRRNDG
jgi:hypothetical protein